MKSKFYKDVFDTVADIPPHIQDQLKFGFVVKYADDVVTGWCGEFNIMTYTSSESSNSVGIKLVNVVMDLGEGLYYHSYINIVGVPVVFFPKED